MIVDIDFPDHPKTVRLARALGPESPLLLLRIWAHCQTRRNDFLGADPEDIASICRWPRDAQTLCNALVTSRWLDHTEDGYIAHGWAERNAGFLAKCKAGKDRAAKASRSASGQLATSKPPASGQLPSQLPSDEPASKQLTPSKAGAEEMRGEENTPTVPKGTRAPVDFDAQTAALEDTVTFLTALFGRKKARLGCEARRQLGELADLLPLSDATKKTLARFHAVPDDPADWLLRSRPQDAEGWAKNIAALCERAEAYAQRAGWTQTEKNAAKKSAAASTPEPHGWHALYVVEYPRADHSLPWASLDPRIQRALTEFAALPA